jgi:hypothetical protein
VRVRELVAAAVSGERHANIRRAGQRGQTISLRPDSVLARGLAVVW